jgi:hypothetical protein
MLIAATAWTQAAAPADADVSPRFALSVGLADYAGDLAVTASATTPWILDGHAAARASAFLCMRDTTMTPYYGFRLGLIGGTMLVSADIRLYGEGGALLLVPTSTVDTAPLRFGGYGHFGFEFFVDRARVGSAYFIELGTNGIGARADAETGTPLYMNGFAASVGFRWYP